MNLINKLFCLLRIHKWIKLSYRPGIMCVYCDAKIVLDFPPPLHQLSLKHPSVSGVVRSK